MEELKNFTLSCPIPLKQYPNILLAHGGGGKLMHNIIENMFLPVFDNPFLNSRHDGAVLDFGNSSLAFTTDSYVVYPLFFPGGDIGKLAVNGTVNDLAMCGARPLYISMGFIIEEGFSMEKLWSIILSIQETVKTAEVQIVTGDTKVVDKGKGDGMFINTTGIGIVESNNVIAPSEVKPGDIIIVNGDIARHGVSIMTVREELGFENKIESDSAPLANIVLELINQGIEIHCLRDLTRGGLASALIEIAETSKTHIDIEEMAIPLREDVKGICEILGLDPLYVANEGRFIAIVKSENVEKALKIMNSHKFGKDSSVIGQVKSEHPSGIVTMKSQIGTSRIVDMISGEQLPRIC
ncbi:MAG: hydrogenase expression/formation protein HypE [Thermodesulfobacteriota bacterium]